MYEIREYDDHQSIMYCPRFADLIDKNAKSFGENSDLSKESLQQYFRDLDRTVSNLTIKEILELTPPESAIIEECVVREGKMFKPTFLSNIECEKFFKITKSLNGERICYNFIPKMRKTYSIGIIATSSTYIGVVYQIKLNPLISSSIVAMFISSPFMIDRNGSYKYPLHSLPYMAYVVNYKTFNLTLFSLYGESIEIKRLPLPYDTQCTPGHDQEFCYESCIKHRLKAISRIPWSGFHKDSSSLKMLTALDLQNETISNYTSNSLEECLAFCKQKSECFTKFSRTTVVQHETRIFSIASVIPSLPHLLLQSVPSCNPVEYIIQVGSCFGMWFGLSIISFNPVKWKTLRKRNTPVIVDNTQRKLFQRSRTKRQQLNAIRVQFENRRF